MADKKAVRKLETLLARYTAREKKTIDEYWDAIRQTRRAGKISDSIMEAELRFWDRFDKAIVLEALAVHVDRYPGYRETYTRGIIRNKAAELQNSQPGHPEGQAPAARSRRPAKRNGINNYEGRAWNYDAIEAAAGQKLAADTKELQERLQDDPRAAKLFEK